MTMDFCGNSLAEPCKDLVPLGQNQIPRQRPTMTVHCAAAVDGGVRVVVGEWVGGWECDIKFQ